MLRITFFDQAPYLGYYAHGDSAFVELPGGACALIDISTKEAAPAIIEKLLKMGVRKIDYFIASHLHLDHTAGFAELCERVDIKSVVFSGYGLISAETDATFMETVLKKNIPVRTVRAGDALDINGVRLDFLFPPAGIPDVSPELAYVEQEKNSNVYSMVMKLSYGCFSALFAGDIYEETEMLLVRERAELLPGTLLKLAHHGCDTSTCAAFLDAVKPRLALTTCRACEWPVQRRLVERKIPVYAPFCDGDVTITTDGFTLNVECDKGAREFALCK